MALIVCVNQDLVHGHLLCISFCMIIEGSDQFCGSIFAAFHLKILEYNINSGIKASGPPPKPRLY